MMETKQQSPVFIPACIWRWHTEQKKKVACGMTRGSEEGWGGNGTVSALPWNKAGLKRNVCEPSITPRLPLIPALSVTIPPRSISLILVTTSPHHEYLRRGKVSTSPRMHARTPFDPKHPWQAQLRVTEINIDWSPICFWGASVLWFCSIVALSCDARTYKTKKIWHKRRHAQAKS